MLEVSKVVFVAFMQHCIQSNVTHVRGVKSVKYFTEQKIKKVMSEVSKGYSVYSSLSPLQEGRPVQPYFLWV